jgi:putative ABC transport system substrate-binding protein
MMMMPTRGGHLMPVGRTTRRAFIAGLGSTAVFPLVARAQQRLVPLIGFLAVSIPSIEKPRLDAFLKRFRELGWVDGRTVNIEYRWAEGRNDRYGEIAAEFARLKVDLIVTAGAAPVSAIKKSTSTIPVVFAIATDPVGTGIVDSLARPGGNATGLSYLGRDIAAKRLEFAREALTGLGRVAILANSGAPGPLVEMQEVERAANMLALKVVAFKIQRAEDIPTTIEMLKDRTDALYVCADPLVNANRISIVNLALDVGLATIFGERENVDAGGLMSYGPNVADMYRRAAELADKILRGVKASDIPVEQPTKLEFVVNLKTAKALGLVVPPSLLARADEVIE